MALPRASDLNYMDAGSSGGSTYRGKRINVISGQGSTRTLLASESGSLVLFDRAAGIIYTLPTPVLGMEFEFQTTVTITSNNAKVITAAATQFLLGTVNIVINTSATTLAALGNGTTHVAITSNGTTTGGVQGDHYKLIAISSTQWAITGIVSGSGSLATPFTTS